MKRVLTAVVLIPVVLLIVFRAPLWFFALAVAGIIILALHEYLSIAETAGYKPFHRLTYAVALLPTLLVCAEIWNTTARHGLFWNEFSGSTSLVKACSILLLLSPVIFGIPLVFRKDLAAGLSSAAVSIFGVAYVGFSLSLLTALRANAIDEILVVLVLFSVWAGDIAAYYVGRSIGRHKLAPVVSPNKSWEGAVASVIGSVCIAVLIFHYQWQISEWFAGPWLRKYWLFPTPSSRPFFFV